MIRRRLIVEVPVTITAETAAGLRDVARYLREDPPFIKFSGVGLVGYFAAESGKRVKIRRVK